MPHFFSQGQSFNLNQQWKHPDGSYQNSSTQSLNKTVICQIYGRENQITIRCYNKYDYEYQEIGTLQALVAISINENDD